MLMLNYCVLKATKKEVFHSGHYLNATLLFSISYLRIKVLPFYPGKLIKLKNDQDELNQYLGWGSGSVCKYCSTFGMVVLLMNLQTW